MSSKSQKWFKSYGHFHEGMDFAYWWRLSGGGSAIKGAILSSLNMFLDLRKVLWPKQPAVGVLGNIVIPSSRNNGFCLQKGRVHPDSGSKPVIINK